MIKKILVLGLTFAMIFAMTACGSSGTAEEGGNEEGTETEEPMSGGWELAENDAAELPEEVQTAFDKAVANLEGNELKPVAYMAQQVVAGMNYMILCESTLVTAEPVTSYQVAVIYADLQGNAEVTQINDFDLAAYTEGEGAERY